MDPDKENKLKSDCWLILTDLVIKAPTPPKKKNLSDLKNLKDDKD